MLRAALLDGDGVLVDSERTYHDAVNRALATYGINAIGDKEYTRLWIVEGKGTAGMIREYGLAEQGVRLEEFKQRRDEIFYGLIETELERIEHAGGLMDMFQFQIGCPLGLVSMDTLEAVRRKQEKAGFWKRFKVKVTQDDVENPKPDPECYQLGLEQMQVIITGLMPHEVLVVEDNPSGVIAAKGVNPEPCKVIAFPNNYTKDMEFPGADKIVYSLKDINEQMLSEIFSD